jgi:hypothetical protein
MASVEVKVLHRTDVREKVIIRVNFALSLIQVNAIYFSCSRKDFPTHFLKHQGKTERQYFGNDGEGE